MGTVSCDARVSRGTVHGSAPPAMVSSLLLWCATGLGSGRLAAITPPRVARIQRGSEGGPAGSGSSEAPKPGPRGLGLHFFFFSAGDACDSSTSFTRPSACATMISQVWHRM